MFSDARETRPNLERTRRRQQEAHDLRRGLLLTLGGKCEECGETLLSVLEVDHVDGRSWSPRAMSQLGRVRRYWAEYWSGVRLRVLCRRCNAVDGALRGNRHVPDPPTYEKKDPVPF